jgi:DNA replication protein DnaC
MHVPPPKNFTCRKKRSGKCRTALNRPIDDWSKLLGDVVVVAPLLDRLMHRGNLLKFEGRSWRLKEAAERVAKRAANA